MALWQFTLLGNTVSYGKKSRKKLTKHGCNEPFRDRYYCPQKKWFMKEPCPFLCQHECRNYEAMCGLSMAQM